MYELLMFGQQTFAIPARESCTLYTLYVLLLALTILPPLSFVLVGWRIRKNSILHGFDSTSARLYLELFHPSADHSIDDPNQELLRLYGAHFGRRKFIFPLLLLFALTATLLYGCLISIFDWVAASDLKTGFLPIEVVLAVMGGYAWTTSDQIERFGRDNLRPGDLFWGSFRLAIAVPMAYSLSRVLNESLALALALLIGKFPNANIVTLARRLVLSKVPEKLARVSSETDESSLLTVPEINTSIAERLHAEGMVTVAQLAYADPVRLTIRTGLGHTFVTTGTCQALAKMYFKEKFDVAVDFGLLGACECRNLWHKFNSDDDVERNAANSLLTELSVAAERSENALRNVLGEIARDPFVEFYYRSWNEAKRQVRDVRENADGEG